MFKSVVSAALLATLLFVLPLLADGPRYDRSTELTLDGTVLYVGEGSLGLYVIMIHRVEPDGPVDQITVQLAPTHFLANGGIAVSTGDRVKVVGCRVNWNGAEMILAREVTKKGRTVALRDRGGVPRW
jgi:hypothetical protein